MPRSASRSAPRPGHPAPRAALALATAVALGAIAGPRAWAWADARLALRAAKERLAARAWADARRALEPLTRDADAAVAGEARLLLARAHLSEGRAEDALAQARATIAAGPDGPAAARARYVEAAALAGLRRFDEAARLLEARADALAAPARRGELAAAYLAIGDGLWPPTRPAPAPGAGPGAPPDWAGAVDAYRRAAALGPEALAARHDEVHLRIGQGLLALGRAGEALAAYEALAARRSPRAGAAALGAAEALLALGRRDDGRAALRALAEATPRPPEAPAALEALARSYGAEPGEEAARLAVEAWRALAQTYPDDPRASAGLLELARVEARRGRVAEALETLDGFVGRRPEAPEAGEARFEAARLTLALGRWDAGRERLAAFVARHADHARFVEAQGLLATSWLAQGDALARPGEGHAPDAARAAWERFLALFPVHPAAPQALRRVGELELARGRTADAVAAWRSIAARWPGSTDGAQALLRVGEVLEPVDPAAAEAAYRQVTEAFAATSEAYAARRALETLRKKELLLVTPRARTTAEGPALTLTTRNVPRLELKAWKLDLVETFRRKHGTGRVEALDLDIVRPDVAWTHEVPDYAAFKRTATELKLPLEGAGAWVVTAEEDDLRATTLVVVSDLTIVVKRAPGQVLVLARDDRTGAPAPGVEVLVSDGAKVVLEGKTGPEGVLEAASDALRAGDLRVLARQGASVAVEGGVAGAGRAAFGYAPKAFVFTDRPIYRPGHTAAWKAFVRHVEAGGYVVRAGEAARVTVRDPRGVRVVEEQRPLGPLGGLDGAVELGEDAPLGTWTVEVAGGGAVGRATFEVEAYKKPEVLVDVAAARDDVLAGEPLELAVAVRTAWGGVVAGAPVSWVVTRRPAPFDREAGKAFARLLAPAGGAPTGDLSGAAGGEVVAAGEATADLDGRCALRVPTAVVDRDMLYAVEVTSRGLDGRPARGGAAALVSTRAFHALVEATTRLARPGEPVRVVVETVEPRRRPVAAEGALEVLHVGPRGEVPVERLAASTGPDGRLELAVTLARAGEHVLRWVGADRRGGRVEGATTVLVEGLEPGAAPRATIRADKAVYRLGEAARVQVGAPAAGDLALVTVEAEQVLSWRVLRLDAPVAALSLPMTARFAPNVVLRVAVPGRDRLLEAEDPLLVLKYLDLSVRASAGEARPGATVTLEVEARDPGGAPVAAEVALAVVDESVYALRADATAPIAPFFYDQRRAHLVRTGSSLAWRYEGVTRAQAREVQEEREERELRDALEAERGARSEALRQSAGGAPPPPPAPAQAPGAGGRARRNGGPAAEKAMADAAPAEEANEADGAAEQVRRRFADTALWAPTVVTGADGKARVDLRLPDDLTGWRVTARGATADTLVGEAVGRVVTRKPLVAALALPRVVTDRDSYAAGLVVDNLSGAPVRGEAALSADGGAAQTQAFAAAPGVAVRLDLPGPVGAPGRRVVRGEVRATPGGPGAEGPALRDALERTVEVRAFGAPEVRGEGGVLEAEAVVLLDVPEDVVPGSASLVLRLSPSAATAILDGLDHLEAFPYGCVEQTVSRFLPLVAAAEVLRASGVPDAALRERLARGVARGVGRLVDLQRPDGGWGWWRDDASQPALTAYALLGLARARAHGAWVDPVVVARAQAACERMLRAGGREDAAALEARALLLHGLAASGLDQRRVADDLAAAQRGAGALSTAGLAHVALAHAAWGLPGGEALAALAARPLGGPEAPVGDQRGGLGWGEGEVEAAAWAGLALATAGGADATAGRLADLARWLRARQAADGGWRSTRETAAALLCLAAVERRGQGAADHELEVRLDGQVVARTRVRGAGLAAERTIVLGADRLAPGRRRLELRKTGVGAPRWVARATWVRRAETVAATGEALRVQAALREADDPRRPRALPGAPSIVRPRDGRPPVVGELALGERCLLEVTLAPREPLPFVQVEVPLPGGLEVVERVPVVGGCDRVEVRDDRVALFFSRLDRPATVALLCQAVVPGRFTGLPATAGPMYAPEVSARGAEVTLTVRADGAARAPSPDERLVAARAHLAAGRHAEARALLEPLEALDLLPQARVEVARSLLTCGVALDAPALVVRAWTALRSASPREADALPLATRRALAQAYRRTGEPARAYALGLEVLHALFQDEVALAELHRRRNERLEAVVHLGRALVQYPDTDPIVAAWFGLAHAYLEVPRPSDAPRPKFWRPEEGLVVDVRVEEAYAAFLDFCAYYPTHPLAPRAQAGAVAALVRLRDHEGVAQAAAAFTARYPRHELTDDVLIERVRALVALGRFDEAFAAGEAVLAHREGADPRTARPSPFCDEVVHTFARVHHQRGELEQARRRYAEVAPRIADARDALTYLTAPDVRLPEVVIARPGEPARLRLEAKNVDAFAYKVYPVDLMVLFLTRKSLAGIHAIDLTGVTPRLEREARLAGTQHRWAQVEVALDAFEPGVYLVVGKAGALDRTCLVVASDLEVDLQRGEGRLRVHVRTRDGRPAAGARVRVTDGARLVARGTTDARGILDAGQDRGGGLSVVVERAGHYALLRE